jgi:hypothetical protein
MRGNPPASSAVGFRYIQPGAASLWHYHHRRGTGIAVKIRANIRNRIRSSIT